MIAETHLQSNVDELGDYLSYGSVGNENRVEDRRERVGWEAGRNLGMNPTMGEAKAAIKADATKPSVEKPVYQVILSWQSGNEEEGIPPDNPSRKEMEQAVDRIREELGLEEHYAWMVGHVDTDTPHVHVVIGRVHPRTGKTWKPSYDETKIYETLREIEEEMGWHRPGPMTIEEKWEQKTAESAEYWEETHEKWGRERSVRLWAREEGIADEMKAATSWPEAQKALRGTRALLKPRGERGMVLKRKGKYAALSAIDAQISRPKLEERFGQTWEEYRREVSSKARTTRPSEAETRTGDAETHPGKEGLTEEGSPEEGPPEGEVSAEESPEEDPAEKDPAEKDPAGKTLEEDLAGEDRAEAEPVESDSVESGSVEAGPREDGRKISFGQEVRIRAAPVLLETERREELQSLQALRRRLAPHGLQVEYDHVEGARAGGSQETLVVSDGERRAPLSAVLPGWVARQISGQSSQQGRRQERPRQQGRPRQQDDWEWAGLLEKPRVKEMKLKMKLIPTGRVGSGGPGGLLLKDASGAARALFQAKPEARGRLLRSAVREAGQSTSDRFLERRLEKLEEEAREEARRRVSLNGRQRALLELTSCLDVRTDWTRSSEELLSEELLDQELPPAELLDERVSSEERPAREPATEEPATEEPVTEEQPGGERSGGGGLSPVERYRRLPPDEQEAVEERMESIVRRELLNQVRQAREEKLGQARDEIEEMFDRGWWRGAAHRYRSLEESRQRGLLQMLSEELAGRLEDRTEEWEEELERARRAREELSGEAQEAFEEACGHLEAATEAPEDEELREPLAPEALSQVAQAWTKVGRELSETDQRALLHQGSVAAMTEEVADSILQEARRLREEGRQGRGQSRGPGRGPERGGFRR
jgi:hypothetical protein